MWLANVNYKKGISETGYYKSGGIWHAECIIVPLDKGQHGWLAMYPRVTSWVSCSFYYTLRSVVWCLELKLMFSLLDRVSDGIQPMLNALEDYIITAGLADMKASADTITTVSDAPTNLVEHKEHVLELGFELSTFSTIRHCWCYKCFIFIFPELQWLRWAVSSVISSI